MDNRRRRAKTREAFLKDVPSYQGTDEDFEKAHYQRYGREEKLGPDGKHHHGSDHFPHGSDREKMHTQYSKSTQPRNDSRAAYNKGVKAAHQELERMSFEEKRYYKSRTGGLPPHLHERLEPRAKDLRETALE